MSKLSRFLLIAQRNALITNQVRVRLLKAAGVKIGINPWIRGDVSFTKASVVIGDYVGINEGVYLDANGLIAIGDYVRIGPRAVIITGSHELEPRVIRRNVSIERPLIVKPVTIERGCWIHSSVTINPGVTVREGCVIAGGAVLTKSTEPNGFYAGVPAERIRDLPTDG